MRRLEDREELAISKAEILVIGIFVGLLLGMLVTVLAFSVAAC